MKEFAKDKVKQFVKKKIWMWIVGLLTASTTLTVILTGALAIILITSLIMLGGEEKGFNENQNIDPCVSGGGTYSGGQIDPNKIKTIFEANAKGGALEGKGMYIVKSAEKHKVPPKIAIAIIAMESGWGKGANATIQRNPYSIMGSGPLRVFPKIEDGIDAGLQNLYDLYISQGLDTPEKIGPKYAPVGASNDPTNLNSNWIPLVKKTVEQFSSPTDKEGATEEKSKDSEKKDDKDKKDYKKKEEDDPCGGLEMSGNAAKLAVSIAYPRNQHAKANVVGADINGVSVAPPKYKTAKKKAIAMGTHPWGEGMANLYASCDRFVATVIINTTDKGLPWGATDTQQRYLDNSPKWKRYTKKSQAKPGDIWVTKTNGHVILYVGKYQGIDTIAHASYHQFVGRVDTAGYLNENLIDTGGRAYYGYHYVGNKK